MGTPTRNFYYNTEARIKAAMESVVAGDFSEDNSTFDEVRHRLYPVLQDCDAHVVVAVGVNAEGELKSYSFNAKTLYEGYENIEALNDLTIKSWWVDYNPFLDGDVILNIFLNGKKEETNKPMETVNFVQKDHPIKNVCKDGVCYIDFGDEENLIKPKKLFVICPMRDRTPIDIIKSIGTMHKVAELAFGESLEIINPYDPNAEAPKTRKERMSKLADDVKLMADADYAVCLDYWSDRFCGCHSLRDVALSYGIKTVHLDADSFHCFDDFTVKETAQTVNE